MNISRGRCHFIPPWLLERVGATDSLVLDDQLRARRELRPLSPRNLGVAALDPAVDLAPWTVHDATGSTSLPGRPARAAGQPESGDEAVDEAAASIEATLAMFADGFGRSSYDGRGAPVTLSVHYGRAYDNAFWDGTHLVFGDGDGEIFERFTKPGDVLAHEFGHAVTEYTAGLVYRGQAGAINESISDVMAACFKQHTAGQTAAEGDWLIGAGIFVPAVQARALRDMAAPGTAYDNAVLGQDPQVGHMRDFLDTDDDNGGVHINSGIPNRAFQLAATAIGGTSLEGAGQIWYAAVSTGGVQPNADFVDFAAATIQAAGEHTEAVTEAWHAVGVMPGPQIAIPAQAPAWTAPTRNAERVRVKRSGGFAGRTEEGEVPLDEADGSVRSLVERIDFDAAVAHAVGRRQMPDMFLYTFQVDNHDPVILPEHALSGDLQELATLVLRRAGQR